MYRKERYSWKSQWKKRRGVFLLLATEANVDLVDCALSVCAMIEVTATFLKHVQDSMGLADRVSAEQRLLVELVLSDWNPRFYQRFPTTPESDKNALDAGWCLLTYQPFSTSLNPEDDGNPECPLHMQFYRRHVTSHSVAWCGRPRDGVADEYTCSLQPYHLVEIQNELERYERTQR
jgi:hypothetical protein